MPSDVAPAGLLYRRIIPRHWRERDGTIDPAAFLPNHGLSVFDAATVPSRRYVLEDHVNKRVQKLLDPQVSDADKNRIQQQVTSGKLTVEALYQEGWRIVEVPSSVFPADVFSFSPVEADGHLNVLGSNEDFELYALECVGQARILTEQETFYE